LAAQPAIGCPGYDAQCANTKSPYRQQAERRRSLLGRQRRRLVNQSANKQNDCTDGDAAYPGNFT
jgi:hypothetical protein